MTTKSRGIPGIEPTVEKSNDDAGSSLSALVLMVVLAIFLQVYHTKIAAPIAPGQVLAPGGWVSRCGLASFLPTCDSSYMEMGNDGILSLFDGIGELEWKMEGGTCVKDDCIEGLEMKDDGRLFIGGRLVPWVNVKKAAEPIAPWPFAVEPKLKVIHGRK